MIIGVLRLIARAPLGCLHRAGALFGWLVFRLSPAYAARLRENLFSSGIEGADKLLPQAVAEAGKGVAELLKIWFGPAHEVASLVHCDDWAVVEQVLARGRGIIFLTPHLGCFDIAAYYGAQRFPITVLYRPPKLRWLEPLMFAGRKRGRTTLAPANFKGVRLLYKALRRGEAVGLLPDQVPGVGEGAWAAFFGRPAYTMTLVCRLQKATNASMIMAFAERLSDARGYRLHLSELPAEGFGEPALNRAVETAVCKCPAQYLWGYNRYKTPAGARMPPCRSGAEAGK